MANGYYDRYKKFPGSPGDALATFRNCDGRIMVFDMQGVCEGQNVSGDYFTNEYTPSNPPPSTPSNCTITVGALTNVYSSDTNDFPLDYKASNILSASHDFVSSNATVRFSAGNTIILSNGFIADDGSTFDAKIDPNLSCSASQFFHKPVKHHPPTGIVNSSFILPQAKSVDSINVLSKPSPTTGQFSVGLIHIDPSEIGQEANISVWNMLGQKITEGNMVIEKENFFPVNLSGKANGIYGIVVKTKDKVFHGNVMLEK